MNKYILRCTMQGYRDLKPLKDTLLVRSQKENCKLLELSKSDFQILWKSEKKCLLFSTDDKYLIYEDGEQETLILNVDNKTVFDRIPLICSFDNNTYSPIILTGTTRTGICVYNFSEKKFYQKEMEYVVELIIHNNLLCSDYNKLNLRLITSEFETLWHFDISQFGTYADKKYINEDPIIRQREINRVYYYHNKIIVTLSRAIIALNPGNGELLWKIDFEKYDPVTLVFNENIAYSGRLIYFATIDIEKGIKLFERNFDPAFRLNIEGFILSQIRYINMTLFQNHLWFVHEDNSRQFLLKANPENGDIVDGMLLETQYSTRAPIFDENRMYILDQDGYLYVYEEVE